MTRNFPKLMKTTNYSLSKRSSKNFIHKKLKKTTPRHLMIQVLKTSDKEKTIKCSHRAKTHYIQRNNNNKPKTT